MKTSYRILFAAVVLIYLSGMICVLVTDLNAVDWENPTLPTQFPTATVTPGWWDAITPEVLP